MNSFFKKWFGASKVVDGHGRPVVVYHGTNQGGFVSFSTHAWSDRGFYFTDSFRMASSYVEDGSTRDPVPREHYLSFSDVMRSLTRRGGDGLFLVTREYFVDGEEHPSYQYRFSNLSELRKRGLEKGWSVTDENLVIRYLLWRIADDKGGLDFVDEFFDDDAGRRDLLKTVNDGWHSGVYAVFLRMENPMYVDCKGSSWAEILYEIIEDENGQNIEVYMSTREIVHEASRSVENYDGVIFKNIIDPGPFGYGDEGGNVYVVFSPSQIKSATANDGFYRSENMDIRSNLSGIRSRRESH